ncbi:MAG: hypothetical protein ACRDOU_04730 [Streptosporangiaceae bacterium]
MITRVTVAAPAGTGPYAPPPAGTGICDAKAAGPHGLESFPEMHRGVLAPAGLNVQVRQHHQRRGAV